MAFIEKFLLKKFPTLTTLTLIYHYCGADPFLKLNNFAREASRIKIGSIDPHTLLF